MGKSEPLVFLLIICTNAFPFLWHKSFWNSVKDTCFACCAISIGTEECIWGRCVDPLSKQCTPFYQKILAKPLQEMGSGSFHTIYAIGGTNLVSKGLDIKNDSDNAFVMKDLFRLPNVEGINRPLCVTKNNANQYKVISERVIAFEKPLMITFKYSQIIADVYGALSRWIAAKTGVVVSDWGANGHMHHNIALTFPKGQPTFFDLDNIHFDELQSEEIIEMARQNLEALKERRRWKEFISEVAKEFALPKFSTISIGIEECIWGKCVDPLSKQCTSFFQKIQTKPLELLGSNLHYTVFAIGDTNLVSKSLLGEKFSHERFVEKDLPRLPKIDGINRPICVTKNEAHDYTMISERVIPLPKHVFRHIIDKYEDIVNEVYFALSDWIEAKSGIIMLPEVSIQISPGGETLLEKTKPLWLNQPLALTLSGKPTFLYLRFNKMNYINYTSRKDFDFAVPKSEEIVKKAGEKLETTTEFRLWKRFINEIAKEIGIPPFNQPNELLKRNGFHHRLQQVFPMELFIFMGKLLLIFLFFFRLRL